MTRDQGQPLFKEICFLGCVFGLVRRGRPQTLLGLGLNPCPSVFSLCDHGQLVSPLCFSQETPLPEREAQGGHAEHPAHPQVQPGL